jgi:subtilisin family serine protease
LIGAEVEKVEGRSVEQALRDLNNRPDVEYAERDYLFHLTGFTDEPRFDELWGLHNTGQTINGIPGVPDVDVNGPEASAITQGDPNLVVAVIDTGADFSHPDLAGRAWTNPGETPGNGVDDDGNGFVDDVNGADFVNKDGNPFDDHDHGTHVSGTIAASVNDQGVVGVAPNVKIMALKIFDAFGNPAPTSEIIKAIQYAKSEGAKISNNSWGGGPFSQALKDGIEASDSLFVAAAGNFDQDNDVNPFYPASYTSANILSVAANDNLGNKAWFSHFGATSVDISAPGVDILSSVPGNQFEYFNGTSMASPHAAGVAALSASVDPALLSDPVALKGHVMDTGKPLPAMAGMTVTGDMVDARAAVTGGNTAPTIKSPKPTGTTRDRTPLISAVVTDAETELNQGNAGLFVDGQAKAFSYDAATDKLRRQSGKLAYGKHTVRVEANDGQLESSKTWSFKVVR